MRWKKGVVKEGRETPFRGRSATMRIHALKNDDDGNTKKVNALLANVTKCF